MKAAKVNTVVNLSDSIENIKTDLVAKDFASPYYAELYKNKQVLTLNMGLAYGSDEFKASIIKGLVFMSENKGPYLFHCTEGKDRTGFLAALIESLMGASKDQIVEDYMQSYNNYYGIQKGTEQYKLISQDVLAMLKVIAGTDNLDKADLAAGANKYLLSGGVTAKQINTFKPNLSTKQAIPQAGKNIYIVVKGDTLWSIASKKLGSGKRYTEIYNINKNIIKNVNAIMSGQKIVLPMK